MGAAPRQRGSREAWTLIAPWRGTSRSACGKISPYAAGHDDVRAVRPDLDPFGVVSG